MAKYGEEGSDVLGRLLPRPLLVRRDVVRLRLRRPDRQDEGRQVGRHARLAAGARRASPPGVTTALKLSRANKTGDEAHPQQALVFAKGKVGSFIGNGWEWPYALDPKVGNPALDRQDRRLPDAEPHQGPVHADLPRRLGPRRSRSRARRRRWRPTGSRPSRARQHDDDGRQGRRDPEHDVARAGSTPPSRRSRRSPRPRSRAGSCRRRRTGPTSRARTSSRTCSAASSGTPARPRSSRSRRAHRITQILNARS